MKKLAITFVAAMIALSCFMMVSCACLTVEGTYKFYSVTFEGQTYKVGDTFQNEVLTADMQVVTVNKNNTFTLTSKYGNETYNQDGTWKKKDGNVYTFTFNDDGDVRSFDVTIKNGTATMTQQGMQFTYKK